MREKKIVENIKEKSFLQSPFRPQNLLSTSQFISYCRDQGIPTSKEQLESLHKEKLLYPAVKVYRGIVEYRKIYVNFNGKKEWRFAWPEDVKKLKPIKISGTKYYSSGSFSTGNETWLDWYSKRKMVEFPAHQKFKKWGKNLYDYFITDFKKINFCCEFFYDKSQFLTLKIINYEKRLWRFLNDAEKEKSKKFIQKRIAGLYRFLDIYIEIEKIFENWIKMKNKKIKELKRLGLNEKQIKSDWRDEFDLDYKPVLKASAENILEKYKINQEYLEGWRPFLAEQNIFHESRRSSVYIKTYLKGMDENFLIKAEPANYMIYIINFLIYCLKNENLTVKQIIGNLVYNYCVICGTGFEPRKTGQITCGNPYCIKENKNKLKRLKRKRNQ